MIARTYAEPSTLDEALKALEAGTATIVAGGTDLVVGARSGKKALPENLVAIHRIDELRLIREMPDGGLRLGALTTHDMLENEPVIMERYTALSDAAALVGSPATRHAGTLGGNLCNASPAMETGSPLLVFDAQVELVSAKGARTFPVRDFLKGPGRTALQPGEMLGAVVLPPPPAGRVGSAYMRLEYRRAMEIAVVGAAALVSLGTDGNVAEARIAITAAAPTCLRVPDAEEVLRGKPPEVDLLEAAAEAAAQAAKPIDDVRAPADYRRAMVKVMARRALELAVSRASE